MCTITCAWLHQIWRHFIVEFVQTNGDLPMVIILRGDTTVRRHVSMHWYCYNNVHCQREVNQPLHDFSRAHNARYCRLKSMFRIHQPICKYCICVIILTIKSKTFPFLGVRMNEECFCYVDWDQKGTMMILFLQYPERYISVNSHFVKLNILSQIEDNLKVTPGKTIVMRF